MGTTPSSLGQGPVPQLGDLHGPLSRWGYGPAPFHLGIWASPFTVEDMNGPRSDWGYLSGTSGSCQHGAFSHFFRLFSTFGVMHQNVVTLGGVCVCFSKSVGKRRFRNVWVGGGRWSQFCAPSCTREDTQGTGNGPGITHYSESDSLSSLPLSARAGTPLGHTSPCL